MVSEEQLRAMQHAAAVEVGEAAMKQARPSVLYRPALVFQGGAWWAILGDDPARHFSACGASPAAAMESFDILFKLASEPLGAERAKEPAAPLPPLPELIEVLSAPIPTPPRSTPLLGNAAVIEWTQVQMIQRLKEFFATR